MKFFLKKIIVSILTLEAKLILKKYHPKIVAVTGSVGKTSTKDAIYAVLKESLFARKSQKSFNSEFGVPLTIIGGRNGWNNPFVWLETIFKGFIILLFKTNYPEWLILEIGADRPGDIKFLTSWVKPDVVVVTRFGDVPVHVEYFKSRKALIDEKTHLPKALKQSGILILNEDDPEVLSLNSHSKGHLITYGIGSNATVSGSNYDLLYDQVSEEKNSCIAGFSFKANLRGNSLPVIRRGIIGEQHMYPALASLAVALALELNIVKANEALAKESLPPGRMRIIAGIKGSTIIDDTYNSSPVAVEQALLALKSVSLKDGRKIAVLGDMLELGKFSTEEHRKAGKLSSEIADIIVTVGLRAKHISEGALSSGMRRKTIYEFENSVDAGRFLDAFVGAGDCVLVKGSQGMRMERIVEEIMAHPEDREKLLVRQDEEWLRR